MNGFQGFVLRRGLGPWSIQINEPQMKNPAPRKRLRFKLPINICPQSNYDPGPWIQGYRSGISFLIDIRLKCHRWSFLGFFGFFIFAFCYWWSDAQTVTVLFEMPVFLNEHSG